MDAARTVTAVISDRADLKVMEIIVLQFFSMRHKKLGPGRPSRLLMYQRLGEAVAELRERMGGLPSPTEADAIWSSIWYEEAHHSTALEGNTLVVKQVEVLLAEGRAVGRVTCRV